jgi:hypothetical protein
MSEQDDINKLITKQSRRLQILKEQKAITGRNTDPSILIEIEDIEAELKELRSQLRALEAPVVTVSPPETSKPPMPTLQPPVAGIPKLFYSYAHEDEVLRDKLATHLKILQRQKKIEVWYDREIGAGAEWEAEVKHHLENDDIILLLISPDFIASDFCYDIEMQRAIERHDAGKAVVIPVILRPTDWGGAPFSKLQALPKDGKPVTRWSDQDEAFTNIAEGVRKVAERWLKLQPGS